AAAPTAGVAPAAAAAAATATAAAAVATTPGAAAGAVGRARTARAKAAATAAAAEAACAGLTFDRFAHGDRATIEQRAVHCLHGCGALIICFHLEEGEAAAAARLAIHDDFRGGNGAELRERFRQTLRRDRIGQVAHKQFTTHSRLGAGERRERSPACACWTLVQAFR